MQPLTPQERQRLRDLHAKTDGWSYRQRTSGSAHELLDAQNRCIALFSPPLLDHGETRRHGDALPNILFAVVAQELVGRLLDDLDAAREDDRLGRAAASAEARFADEANADAQALSLEVANLRAALADKGRQLRETAEAHQAALMGSAVPNGHAVVAAPDAHATVRRLDRENADLKADLLATVQVLREFLERGSVAVGDRLQRRLQEMCQRWGQAVALPNGQPPEQAPEPAPHHVQRWDGADAGYVTVATFPTQAEAGAEHRRLQANGATWHHFYRTVPCGDGQASAAAPTQFRVEWRGDDDDLWRPAARGPDPVATRAAAEALLAVERAGDLQLYPQSAPRWEYRVVEESAEDWAADDRAQDEKETA